MGASESLLAADLMHKEAAGRRAVIEAYWAEVGALHPFSAAAVRQTHGTAARPWVIYKGDVINCTTWKVLHPGGAMAITMLAGQDCTEDFDRAHRSANALARAKEYTVARLYVHPTGVPALFNACAESTQQVNAAMGLYSGASAPPSRSPTPGGESAAERKAVIAAMAAALNRRPPPAVPAFGTDGGAESHQSAAAPASAATGANAKAAGPSASPAVVDDSFSVKVASVSSVGSRTKAIVFTTDRAVKVAPGGHISVLVPVGGAGGAATTTATARSYSPVSEDATSFTVLVKHYPGGVGSGHLHGLAPGASVRIRGPIPPAFDIQKFLGGGKGSRYHAVLVAGGTGAAPVLRMARHAAAEGASVTVALCFRDRQDAMLLPEFQKLHNGKSVRVTVIYSRDPDAIRAPRPPDAMQVRGKRFDAQVLAEIAAWQPSMRFGVVCGPPTLNSAVVPMFTGSLYIPTACAFALQTRGGGVAQYTGRGRPSPHTHRRHMPPP